MEEEQSVKPILASQHQARVVQQLRIGTDVLRSHLQWQSQQTSMPQM